MAVKLERMPVDLGGSNGASAEIYQALDTHLST